MELGLAAGAIGSKTSVSASSSTPLELFSCVWDEDIEGDRQRQMQLFNNPEPCEREGSFE